MSGDLTLGEAARAIGVSVDTLRRWDRAGKLQAHRDSRKRRVVSAEEVQRLTAHPRRRSTRPRLSARNRFTGVIRQGDVGDDRGNKGDQMNKQNLVGSTLAACTVALLAVGFSALPAAPAGAASAPGGPVGRAAAKASVSALFAGSLVDYMEDDFGPAFTKATGYGYEGYGGGSTELAAEIKGGVRQGDVFISAAASADTALEGSANGNWVSWYSTFAASPLLLAYDPSSKFGKELASGVPWYKVLTQPGILVGRTDPKLDPKGILTVEAVDNAAKKLHDPALAKALNSFPVYPETALVGRLQSGQLDAGFFYAIEASAAHLKTVSLNPVYKVADYTVTILNRSSNQAGAAALIRYLLNSQRSYTLKKNGLTPLKPQFSGRASDVPASLRKLVGAS